MKHKKRGKHRIKHKAHKKRSYKKKEKMRSPLIITLIILILFVVLIIFSIFKGPVEVEEVDEDLIDLTEQQDITERVKEQRKENKVENPSIRINKAIASRDISICEGNEECEISYVFATAKNDNDCNLLENINLRNTCKERI